MEAARRSLEYAASHDPLTGTLNRTGLAACLGGHVAASCARGTPPALLVVDLDHFKQVNDTFGHGGGDVVLREAAERIVRAVRPTDAVGRMGGEEFMVILPGCSPEAAEIVGERVRAAVASRPFHVDERPLAVTCSVGAASGVGTEATESLTARADAAMYLAKQSGRNRVCGAPPPGRADVD
jgi:diguanylate cyclase (GGDEF)-like protein